MSASGGTGGGLPDPLPEYLEASARAAIAAVEADDLAEARRLWTTALEAIAAADLRLVGGRGTR
jgi:hypothetical protein